MFKSRHAADQPVDRAVIIKEDMTKPQRAAPCIACKMGDIDGTLLLSATEGLFFKSPDNVLQLITYANVVSYGIESGSVVVRQGVKKIETLSFSPDADQPEHESWMRMVIVYLDVVFLRHLAHQERSANLNLSPRVDFHKDVSADDPVDSETLICDKRAFRYEAGVSAQSRTISGIRFPVMWRIRLKGLKQALSMTSSDIVLSCVLIPGSMGIALLLPVQNILLPIYFREIPTFGSKKSIFSIRHQIRKDSQQLFIFESIGEGSMIEKAMREQLEKQASDPFPRLYPPMKNFSAAHLAVPLTEEETKQIEAQTKSLSEKRYQLMKGKSKLLKQPNVKQHFTMRFVAGALNRDSAEDEDDSDDLNDQDYLDMIDNQ